MRAASSSRLTASRVRVATSSRICRASYALRKKARSMRRVTRLRLRAGPGQHDPEPDADEESCGKGELGSETQHARNGHGENQGRGDALENDEQQNAAQHQHVAGAPLEQNRNLQDAVLDNRIRERQ